MCGISVVFSAMHDRDSLHALNNQLIDSLGRRGPDGRGLWASDRICLGHTRLAITDLSESGSQPMISRSGRVRLVFNGEIYNRDELLEHIRLENPLFNPLGTSDTEILLEYVDLFGHVKAVKSSRGMFAFCSYLTDSQQLSVCTDVFGEKKLFFKISGGVLYIHSELAALASVGERSRIRADFISEYFDYGFSIGAKTCYEDVFSFGQNQCTSIDIDGVNFRFHSTNNVVTQDDSMLSVSTDKSILDVISYSVASQLQENKLGSILLSGGVDSTLISAVASKLLGIYPPTFTARFGISEYDECEIAKRHADLLGLEHLVVDVSDEHVSLFLSNIHEICGQPFGDSSIVSIIALSRAVSEQGYKYVLTGDGGDEIFLGYHRYRAAHILKKFEGVGSIFLGKKISKRVRKTFAYCIQKLSRSRSYLSVERLKKLEYILSADSHIEPSIFFSKLSKSILIRDSFNIICETVDHISVENLRAWDLSNYLPNDILFKGDKGCMWNSVENRAPFLCPSLLSISNRIPMGDHINVRGQKRVLRQVLSSIFPEYQIKSKKGFSAPLGLWVENQMSPRFFEKQKIVVQDIFDPDEIKSLELSMRRGGCKNISGLWSYICFQNWYEQFNKCEL